MNRSKWLLFLGLTALAACVVPPGEDGETEEPEASDAEELTAGIRTFYAVRRDFRKCVAPLCGGYWVRRLNTATTRCADGRYEAECYVTEIDLGPLGLPEALASDVLTEVDRLVVRGWTIARTHPSFGKLGRFRATEAWRAPAAGAATGTVYKVGDNGVRCVTAPCPSLDARKLNSSAKARQLVDLDLSGAPGTAADDAEAAGDLATHDLLVAGALAKAPGGLALTANQYYRRVRAGLPVGASCTSDDACEAGLRCCYPCGIPGCTNVCTAAPGGECPLIP